MAEKRIVPRAEWGARAPKARTTIALPTPRTWVHHTAGNEKGAAGMRSIQAYHMDVRNYNDIAYSFVIDNDDGVIYEGRGAGVAGAHTEGDNSSSHGLCAMGNFENEHPSQACIDSYVWLSRHGVEKGWWVPTLGGHRDNPYDQGNTTECPGDHLYARLPEIRARVNDEDDDMGLTDDDRKWIEQQLATVPKTYIIKGQASPQWWATDLVVKRYIPNRDHANLLIVFGARCEPNNQPYIWEQDDVDALPVIVADG